MPLRDLKRAWCAALVLLLPLAARGQEPPPSSPGAGAENFTVFIRGTPVGSEQIAVMRSAEGWTVASSGRLGAPVDVVSRRVEVQYDGNWNPRTVSAAPPPPGQYITNRSTRTRTTPRPHLAQRHPTTQRHSTHPPPPAARPPPPCR